MISPCEIENITNSHNKNIGKTHGKRKILNSVTENCKILRIHEYSPNDCMNKCSPEKNDTAPTGSTGQTRSGKDTQESAVTRKNEKTSLKMDSNKTRIQERNDGTCNSSCLADGTRLIETQISSSKALDTKLSPKKNKNNLNMNYAIKTKTRINTGYNRVLQTNGRLETQADLTKETVDSPCKNRTNGRTNTSKHGAEADAYNDAYVVTSRTGELDKTNKNTNNTIRH